MKFLFIILAILFYLPAQANNITFHVKGTDPVAYRANGIGTFASLGSTNFTAASASAISGAFGGYVLDFTSAVRSISYQAGANFPSTKAFTVLLRYAPLNTGGANANLFEVNDPAGSFRGGIRISNQASDIPTLVIIDNLGNTAYNNNIGSTALGSTASQMQDVWVTYDGTTNANGVKLWVAQNGNSPTNIGSGTASAYTASSRNTFGSGMGWGRDSSQGQFGAYVNEIVIWDGVENPTSYGVRAGFIPDTAYIGYSNTDPGISNVRSGTSYTVTGSSVTGTAAIPTASQVLSGVSVDATVGNVTLPTAAQVLNGVGFGASSGTTGTVVLPSASNVRSGTTYGASSGTTGTCAVPTAANVRLGVSVDATTGLVAVPTVANVLSGVAVDQSVGTYVGVSTGNVKIGTTYGASSALTGTYDGSDRWSDPGAANVRAAIAYKSNSTTNNQTGTVNVPVIADVKHGVSTDVSGVGTYRGYDLWSNPGATNVLSGNTYLADGISTNGRWTSVGASKVLSGWLYGIDGTSVTGTLNSTDPGISNVTLGTQYYINSVSRTGTYVPSGTIDPGVSNVRLGVGYALDGIVKTGTLNLPSVADVRSGVSFDNGSDGTLVSTDPGISNVASGIPYTINNTPLTGSLLAVTNILHSATMLSHGPYEDAPSDISFSRGDDVVIDLYATNGKGAPVNLTGATYQTQLLGSDGTFVTLDNSHHVTVEASIGKYEITMSDGETSRVATGANKDIITKIIQAGKALFYRGRILNVFQGTPQQ